MGNSRCDVYMFDTQNVKRKKNKIDLQPHFSLTLEKKEHTKKKEKLI